MTSPANAAGLVGIGGSAAGGILGAFEAEATGQAQQGMYNYQAGIANLNAAIAKQNADYAINAGEQQAQSYGLQAGQRFGQIVTAQSSSGIDVNSGSAKQVQAGQKLVTSMDLTQIRSNANKTAYDFENQAVGFQSQATLDTLAGKNAAAAGNINVASSVLGSAASVSSKWLQGNQLGLWG